MYGLKTALRSAALALCVMVLAPNGVTLADASTATGIVATKTTAKQKPAAQPVFNGPRLYNEALDAVLKYHLRLTDPAKNAAFNRAWRNKFSAKDLSTEEGTDQAIAQMLASIKQRHDGYFDASDSAEFDESVNGAKERLGVGVEFQMVIENDAPPAVPAPPAPAAKDAAPAPIPQLSAEQKAELRRLFEEAQKAAVPRFGKKAELIVGGTLIGGPADDILLPRDKVLSVDGKSIEGETLDEVIARINAHPRGDNVTFTVVRYGKTLTVTVKRDIIPNHAVKRVDLGDGITLIRVKDFIFEQVEAEFVAALEEAAKGKGIIVDLRGNPGGELQKALRMASRFLPDGAILVQREREGSVVVERSTGVFRGMWVEAQADRKDRNKQRVQMTGRPPMVVPANMPVRVLIDAGSASASEIFAGALQANRRAVVMGSSTSYGKNVGQLVVPLSYGRQIHITTFEFLPGGVEMEPVGLLPDKEVHDDINTQDDEEVLAAVADIKKDLAASDRNAAWKKDVQTKRKLTP